MSAVLDQPVTSLDGPPMREAALLPYQRAWIEDESKVAIFEKSRRIGADWCEALRAVRERITGTRTCDYWYSSADEAAAAEFMIYVKMWARDVYGAVLNIIEGVEVFDDSEIKVMSVTFPEVGGRCPRISAMTSSPNSFRSKGGDVCLSEFAHHKFARDAWKAATPVTTWGGRLRVISTHNGEDSVFNQLLGQVRRRDAGEGRPGDLRASIHRVTIEDAIDDGLVERINAVHGLNQSRDEFREDCRSQCLDDSDYDEEFNCKPNSDEDSYFPRSLTRPCVHHQAPLPTENLSVFLTNILRHGEDADALYAGVDIGRRKDLFVIWVYARTGAMRRTAGILIYDRQKFSAMKSAIFAMMDLTTKSGARVQRICIDETGIGMNLAEDTVDRYRSRAEGITFTPAIKVQLFTTAHTAVEDRTCDLPDDPIVLADLACVRKVTVAGNIRFDLENTDFGHCDRAVAWTLALIADEKKKTPSYGFVKLEDRR